MLKCFCTTIFFIACFILLNTIVCKLFRSKFFLDVAAERSGRIGADSVAEFGKIL